MKSLVVILSLTFCFNLYAQSKAEAYFSIIRKAENHIVAKNLDSALFYYNLAFTEFETPFVRELYQATIIASYCKNLDQFYDLLPQCIERGMNRSELNEFNDRFKKDSSFIGIQKRFDTYHQRYLASIDTAIYNTFEAIDRKDQIRTKHSIKLNQILDKEVRGFHTLSELYRSSVLKYGWPIESTTGIGNIEMAGVVKKDKINKLPKIQYDNIVLNVYDSILCKDTTEHFVLVSGKSFSTSILYQNSRKGNGFLWHHLEHLDSTLNNFVLRGMKDLKIHPLFVAQAIERSETTDNDCLLGMGSMYYGLELGYKKHSKYTLDSTVSSRFNANRAKYQIRSLEDEKELLEALFYYECGKDKDRLPKSFFRKHQFLIEIFTNANVG